MPRGPLRKIDRALDLSDHLTTVENLPRPWNAAALFGCDAPLEVEVGSGKGLFMETASRARPEHNFLGIEISRKYAHFAAARLAKHELTNGRMVHGDALRVFYELLPEASAAAVHVYFPDPWWKKRHRKRRVMVAPFVKSIERVLIPGGSLHFWTDVKEYFDETLDLIAAETSLTGPIPVDESPAEHHLDYRTHFERRMRLDGEPVYRSEFRKHSSKVMP